MRDDTNGYKIVWAARQNLTPCLRRITAHLVLRDGMNVRTIKTIMKAVRRFRRIARAAAVLSPPEPSHILRRHSSLVSLSVHSFTRLKIRTSIDHQGTSGTAPAAAVWRVVRRTPTRPASILDTTQRTVRRKPRARAEFRLAQCRTPHGGVQVSACPVQDIADFRQTASTRIQHIHFCDCADGATHASQVSHLGRSVAPVTLRATDEQRHREGRPEGSMVCLAVPSMWYVHLLCSLVMLCGTRSYVQTSNQRRTKDT